MRMIKGDDGVKNVYGFLWCFLIALQMIATLFIRDENINIDLFIIEHFKVPPSSAVLKIPA